MAFGCQLTDLLHRSRKWLLILIFLNNNSLDFDSFWLVDKSQWFTINANPWTLHKKKTTTTTTLLHSIRLLLIFISRSRECLKLQIKLNNFYFIWSRHGFAYRCMYTVNALCELIAFMRINATTTTTNSFSAKSFYMINLNDNSQSFCVYYTRG